MTQQCKDIVYRMEVASNSWQNADQKLLLTSTSATWHLAFNKQNNSTNLFYERWKDSLEYPPTLAGVSHIVRRNRAKRLMALHGGGDNQVVKLKYN